MEDAISILIASRKEEDREHIHAILSEQANFYIVGAVKDETGAIIKSEHFKPNILILDLQLSEIDGSGLIRIIRRKSPSTAIIVLYDKNRQENIYASNTENQEDYQGSDKLFTLNMAFIMSPVEIFAILSFMSGISGFLIWQSDIDKLVYIIKIVFMGGYYINPLIIVRIFNTVNFLRQFSLQTNTADFSPAERSIIMLLAHGLSDDEIAEELNYSAETVRNCVTKIRNKIKIKSRKGIVFYSLMSGLISLEQLMM